MSRSLANKLFHWLVRYSQGNNIISIKGCIWYQTIELGILFTQPVIYATAIYYSFCWAMEICFTSIYCPSIDTISLACRVVVPWMLLWQEMAIMSPLTATLTRHQKYVCHLCMYVCTHWIVLGSLWLLYLCDGVILWWYFTALLYLTLLFPGTSCKLFLCWTWTRSGKGSSSLLFLPYGPRPQSVLHSVQWWWLLQSNMLWIW